MFELAGQERLGDARKAVRIRRVVEDRASGSVDEHLVCVHARAGRVRSRFGHEGRLHAASAGQLFDRRLESDDGVGRDESGQEREVQFELAARHLVVTRLDTDAHGFETGHDL